MAELAVLSVAGGNPTAIALLDAPLHRVACAAGASALFTAARRLGQPAEQVGYLFGSTRHFEMAGGELCGNATLSAALLLAASDRLRFTASGAQGTVQARLWDRSPGAAQVEILLPGAPPRPEPLPGPGAARQLVRMAGISHVVIDGPAPADPEAAHRALRAELQLDQAPAIGVIWRQAEGAFQRITPAVWVRGDPDRPQTRTFCIETACGSGSIAAALAYPDRSEIVQPTGQLLHVRSGTEGLYLSGRVRRLLRRPLPPALRQKLGQGS